MKAVIGKFILGCFVVSGIGLLTMSASLALASESAPQKRWFCTADGYDGENQLQTVTGEVRPTRKAAEESALKTCRGFAYRVCQVKFCSEMPGVQ